MPAGLPAGTITVRRFLAKVWGASARPSLTAASIFASSAEANTSAGAPCSSCVRRVELPAKFSFTSVPGCSSSKLAFSSPKASVSEEAAKTVKAVSSPSSELPGPPHPNETGSSAATTTQDKSFALTSPTYAPYGCGFPMPRLVTRGPHVKGASARSLCALAQNSRAARRVFGPLSLEDARRRDCEDHPEHQSGCRRWQELNQESLCYHADNRPYPNWRYRLGTAAPPFNGLVHPNTRRKPTRLTS